MRIRRGARPPLPAYPRRRRRMFAPARQRARNRDVLGSPVRQLACTTASAPSGISAPVMIRDAAPPRPSATR